MSTPLIKSFSGQKWPQYTRPKEHKYPPEEKNYVAQTSEAVFFGTEIREIWKSGQDDANGEYDFRRVEFLNFRKEFTN